MRLALFACATLLILGVAALRADDPSVIFSDDFSTLDPAWGVGDSHIRVDGGAMVVMPDVQTCYTLLYQGNLFNDTDISATVILADGVADANPGGIAFWGSDLSNYYLAGVDAAGNFGVSRYDAGKWVYPVAWNAQAAVKKGVNQPNTVRVVTKGRTATIYVNGTQVTSIKGFPPDGGSEIGFYGDSGAKVYTWKFSNFVVRKPQ